MNFISEYGLKHILYQVYIIAYPYQLKTQIFQVSIRIQNSEFRYSNIKPSEHLDI